MKKILPLLIASIILSCDDGDIVVEDLDFDGVALQACLPTATTGDRDYVFYKIDQSNFESLSLEFSTSDDILTVDGTYSDFDLNNDNIVDYRRYNAAPDRDYFCGNVPPVSPRVTESFDAENGTFIITTTTFSLDDNDGIPSDLESGLDSDNDGLPDNIDTDDDGDNVPTNQEGVVIVNGQISMNLSLDTDGDNIPNYLDPDDDGDGIPTIQEDLNGNLDPRDDLDEDETPFYLNAEIRAEASTPINEYRPNSYTRRSALQFDFQNLVLNGEGKELVFDQLDFGSFTTSGISITVTPEFVED
ncbi:hypothetical protein [Nonlabens ponticola]|uniref:Uncharacterized protein n=1 Tax=Nonlabens ponticola TaxID=2496866 RepID=A0A3S9MXJ8_9FLAO|nr:hypothetical protein [Nonlabens ponticola]AZQ43773.1 hypothetical protein EJ995_05845 [Nonlabens ponticola]